MGLARKGAEWDMHETRTPARRDNRGASARPYGAHAQLLVFFDLLRYVTGHGFHRKRWLRYL